MTEAERAYVGALIDADGCVSKHGSGLRITFANTNLELISALLRAVGRGNVRLLNGPYRRKNPSWKRFWAWELGCQIEVRELAQQCFPYSQKLQRVEV